MATLFFVHMHIASVKRKELTKNLSSMKVIKIISTVVRVAIEKVRSASKSTH
jgi:hypothetical protein